jgi:hypothetical protein
MSGKGCIVALMASVKSLSSDISSQEGTMDRRVYENAMKELSAMKRFM